MTRLHIGSGTPIRLVVTENLASRMGGERAIGSWVRTWIWSSVQREAVGGIYRPGANLKLHS